MEMMNRNPTNEIKKELDKELPTNQNQRRTKKINSLSSCSSFLQDLLPKTPITPDLQTLSLSTNRSLTFAFGQTKGR